LICTDGPTEGHIYTLIYCDFTLTLSDISTLNFGLHASGEQATTYTYPNLELIKFFLTPLIISLVARDDI